MTAPYTKASEVPPSPDSQENIGKYCGCPLKREHPVVQPDQRHEHHRHHAEQRSRPGRGPEPAADPAQPGRIRPSLAIAYTPRTVLTAQPRPTAAMSRTTRICTTSTNQLLPNDPGAASWNSGPGLLAQDFAFRPKPMSCA